MASIPAALGLSAEQTEHAIRYAGAAPSLHNSQPWRFRVTGKTIEVHGDPQRRLPAADPDDRELRLACGAALLNLRLTVAHEGIRPVLRLLPPQAGPTALAEIRSGGRTTQLAPEQELYQAIPKRRSNRRPFSDTPVPIELRHALIVAVAREHSALHVVDRPQLHAFEELVRHAHREHEADPQFRAEFAQWTGRPAGTTEGVPVASAGPRPEPQDKWVRRDFSGGLAAERVPGKEFEQEPLLAVVCAHQDNRLGDLRAGQALQRLLLTATAHGLAASLLSQVVEVPETRQALGELLGTAMHPRAVLRIGYGSPAPATPRRDVADLLMD